MLKYSSSFLRIILRISEKKETELEHEKKEMERVGHDNADSFFLVLTLTALLQHEMLT